MKVFGSKIITGSLDNSFVVWNFDVVHTSVPADLPEKIQNLDSRLKDNDPFYIANEVRTSFIPGAHLLFSFLELELCLLRCCVKQCQSYFDWQCRLQTRHHSMENYWLKFKDYQSFSKDITYTTFSEKSFVTFLHRFEFHQMP